MNNNNNKDKNSITTKPPKALPRSFKKRVSLEDAIQSYKSDAIVSFTGKNLRKFSHQDLEKYKKCQGFDFSHNSLNLTSQLCFEFKNVRYLNLSHNGMKTLPQAIHLMENLVYLDVSDNKIARLPLNIYRMTKLKFLDVRGNPILATWNERRGIREAVFDPEAFTTEIKSFMMAVKDWRDYNLRFHAEEYLEYLLICPPISPSPDDAEYDLEAKDYKNCPFYNLMQTKPEQVKRLISILDESKIQTGGHFEEFLFEKVGSFVNVVVRGILSKGLWNMFVIFVLAVAFFDKEHFAQASSWLPAFAAAVLNPAHEMIQSRLTIFPIPLPIIHRRP